MYAGVVHPCDWIRLNPFYYIHATVLAQEGLCIESTGHLCLQPHALLASFFRKSDSRLQATSHACLWLQLAATQRMPWHGCQRVLAHYLRLVAVKPDMPLLILTMPRYAEVYVHHHHHQITKLSLKCMLKHVLHSNHAAVDKPRN
jgi:hypothetical protein